MRTLKQSTARNVMVFLTDSSDHLTGKTGLTLTITASKNGGAFASITPTVTERGSGWYSLALTTSHTDTLGDLALHVTGAGADPADAAMVVDVVAPDANLYSWLGAVPASLDNGGTVLSAIYSVPGGGDSAADGLGALGVEYDANLTVNANVTNIAGQTATASTGVTFPGTIGTSTLTADGVWGNATRTLSGGVTLATSQPNYAPAKAGDAMTLTSGERSSIAAAVWAYVVVSTRSAGFLLRKLVAVVMGRTSGAGTTTEKFADIDGTDPAGTPAVTVTLDSSDNRTGVTHSA